MNLQANTVLNNGKYTIKRFISSGGFGCTYEGVEVNSGNPVAIKEFFVSDYCTRDENTSQVRVATQSNIDRVNKLKNKFIEEARVIASFNHRGIVHVYDVFEENGTAYYVMNYISGPSLRDIIKREGAVEEDRALRYIKDVAEALAYVHERGRLHLDIKPGNILIDRDGHAVLIDFGVSKQFYEDGGANNSTMIGLTPGFAPIEQSSGDMSLFTPATDIYALGATLYALLSGVAPHPAAALISGKSLKPLSEDISVETRKGVAAAMRIYVKDRPKKIQEFLDILDCGKAKAVEDKDAPVLVADDDPVYVIDENPDATRPVGLADNNVVLTPVQPQSQSTVQHSEQSSGQNSGENQRSDSNMTLFFIFGFLVILIILALAT